MRASPAIGWRWSPISERRFDTVVAGEGGTAYLLATYTAMLDLRHTLVERGVVRPYWEAA